MMATLHEPFSVDLLEFKPGATNRDKTRALALAYVDSRHYMERLDAVDPGWSDDYQVLDNSTVICRLTVNGITRTDLGQKDEAEQNSLTSAAAQAFKRACTKFGLGRYLYTVSGPLSAVTGITVLTAPTAMVAPRRTAHGRPLTGFRAGGAPMTR